MNFDINNNITTDVVKQFFEDTYYNYLNLERRKYALPESSMMLTSVGLFKTGAEL